MSYLVEHKKPGESWKEIYQGPGRGWAWRQFFDYQLGRVPADKKLQPEDKVRIKEKNPSRSSGWQILRTFIQYY